MEQPVQISLFDYLAELEGNDREIEIKGAINTKKSLKEIEGVRLSYGDLTLILALKRAPKPQKQENTEENTEENTGEPENE